MGFLCQLKLVPLLSVCQALCISLSLCCLLHVEDELCLFIPRPDHPELASLWPSVRKFNNMPISSAPAHQQDMSA